MKILKPVFFLFSSLLFYQSSGQSSDFKESWSITQKYIQQIDSSSRIVKKQRRALNNRRHKIKTTSSDYGVSKRVTKVKYSKGDIRVRHRYKIRRKIKISVLIVNGETKYIRSKFKNSSDILVRGKSEDRRLKVKNKFLNVGGNKWYWTQWTNDINQTTGLEIINNWH
jgi:hypothetical protein